MPKVKISWDQIQRRIEAAERKILDDIIRTQIIFYSPERIAQLFPNGYDLSTIPKHTGTVETELRVIGGVFKP